MDCPLNKTLWEQRSMTFGCQNIDVYHCLLLQDKANVKEVCIERSLVKNGQCPILTHSGYIHWTECNTTGCPDTFYRSDEAYKYPICLRRISSAPLSNNNQLPIGLGVGIPLFLVMFLVIILMYFLWKRRQPNSRDSNATDEEMPLREVDDNAAVESIMPKLRKKEKLLVVGKLGNGVSTTAKTAIQRFVEHHEWTHIHVNFCDVLNLSFKEKTIVFVDGWFGIWNENPCAVEHVDKILKKLREQVDNLKYFKLVLGVREDIYKKYKDTFAIIPFDCFLDLDSSRVREEEELESHFQRVFSDQYCNKRNCGCRNLDIHNITHKNHDVGDHLVIDILARDHRLIPGFMECWDLLETLVCHFDALWKKKRVLVECLMYIVVQGKYKQGDNVNTEIKNSFHFSITADSFQNCKSLRKYIKHMQGTDLVNVHEADVSHAPESIYLVFHHVILYLAAFHSMFKRYPTETMKHCNIDAILQIVRPERTEGVEDLIKFCVKADNETVKFFYKEVVKQKSGLEEKLKNHPLVKHVIGTGV